MHLSPRTTFKVQGIAFDLDGTLVNSTVAVTRVWADWARDNNVELSEVLRIAQGRRTIDTLRLVAPPGYDCEAGSNALSLKELEQSGGVFPILGAKELLQSLSDLPWAVVTSAPLKLALSRLTLAGLPIPKHLVSAEDVKIGKPNPEGYLTAAVRLKLAPADMLIVEDAPAGLDAAHATSPHVIAIASDPSSNLVLREQWVRDLSCLSVTRKTRSEFLVSVR